MKHLKLFENFNQSLVYDGDSDGGSIQGILHYDRTKIDNWLYKRGLSSSDYNEYIEVPIAFLNNINVYEEERNQGYGFQMYDEFENWCIDNMATGIILESDSYESQQEGFNLDDWYIKLGFEIIDDREDNKIMYKKLEE